MIAVSDLSSGTWKISGSREGRPQCSSFSCSAAHPRSSPGEACRSRSGHRRPQYTWALASGPEAAHCTLPFMVAGHLQFDSPLFPRDHIEADRLNAPPDLKRALSAPEAFPRFAQMIVPAFSLEPPPKACRMKLGAMSASANRLHRIMPGGRFKDVSRAAQPVFGVLHVTTPAPADRARSNHNRSPNLPKSREQVRGQHHHADVVQGQ